ncbi:hypothetical protein Aglo01_04600 [Actinokineospora globicatena]|nr:hypothetical protein Aglo01_04600 [Actinokineospora globicatena]GLW82817.1 hypothetical protein Aglo02_04570 [Actinokineospora globicatena]
MLEQEVVLEDHADPTLLSGHKRAWRLVPHLAVESDVALLQREQTCERTQRGCLTGTVRPQYDDYLARFNGER